MEHGRPAGSFLQGGRKERREVTTKQVHLVQLQNGGERAIALVEQSRLQLLKTYTSMYDLAFGSVRSGGKLSELALANLSDQFLDYDLIYKGESAWKLLPPLDHPSDPSRVLVSGTGLTHKASADNRAAMHQGKAAAITDSARMYAMGKEGGRPAPGTIGVQPEWFYKGTGGVLRGHGDDLLVPAYADDGGEEPEIAGTYVIADDGQPCRLGLMIGNEFSDHVMEKKNYLYLAPSKLRNCSVGPELSTEGSEVFQDVRGSVAIQRGAAILWRKDIFSGEMNMCHSLENLEHHHFKYEMHRRPGDVHIHFFGADAFSFGEGLRLEDGDVMEVDFPTFGRSLRNRIRIVKETQRIVQVRSLG